MTMIPFRESKILVSLSFMVSLTCLYCVQSLWSSKAVYTISSYCYWTILDHSIS